MHIHTGRKMAIAFLVEKRQDGKGPIVQAFVKVSWLRQDFLKLCYSHSSRTEGQRSLNSKCRYAQPV